MLLKSMPVHSFYEILHPEILPLRLRLRVRMTAWWWGEKPFGSIFSPLLPLPAGDDAPERMLQAIRPFPFGSGSG